MTPDIITTVDLSPLWHSLAELAAAVIGAVALAIGAPLSIWLNRHLGVTIPQATIDAAAKRAGGIAYDAIIAAGGRVNDPVIHGQALAAGLDHLTRSVPGALQKLGVTDDAAARLVRGELGRLLAVDPTVSAGTPQEKGQ